MLLGQKHSKFLPNNRVISGDISPTFLGKQQLECDFLLSDYNINCDDKVKMTMTIMLSR